MPAAAASLSTQSFQPARSWTASALSGRQVGAELGARLGVLRVPSVRLQVVDGIVGAADHLHVVLREQPLRRELRLRQPAVAVFVDLLGGVRPEQLARHAERELQLQVRPVVERVAQGLRHRRRPRRELVPVGRVAGDVALGHARRPHRAPLVVVALQPDLGDRPPLVVVGDLMRRQVAVVVDDRLRPRVLLVEIDRDLAVEEEIVVEEALHFTPYAGSEREADAGVEVQVERELGRCELGVGRKD